LVAIGPPTDAVPSQDGSVSAVDESGNSDVVDQRTQRLDIQALRAIAVATVVIFHLWPAVLPSGFIGVDVFFVISGFLITSHLVRESVTTGRISLTRFWSRRAKRLLPAAFTVLLVVELATFIFVPMTRWHQFSTETIASALYVENWLLSANAVDYMASTNPASPVQNFWTLSVEEQFYIVVPLMLIGAAFIASRARVQRRGALAMVIVIATAVSFVWGVYQTSSAPPLAYLSTLTRAWEFGVGALLGFVTWRMSGPVRNLLTAVGITMIVVAAFVLGSSSFPGVSALLPVIGTAVVIAANSNQTTWLSSVGSWAWVAFLGAISYSLYLWHWPLIVLVPFVTGKPLSGWVSLAVVVGAIAAATLSYHLIENPMRYAKVFSDGGRGVRRVVVAAIVGSLVVILPGVIGLNRSEHSAEVATARAAALVATNPDCLGAQTMDPARTPCVNPVLDNVLVPDPIAAARDDSNRAECWATNGVTELHVCPLGAGPGVGKHLIAVGDSHNNTLIAAYEQIAKTNHWQIDVAGHRGCYWTAAIQVQDVQSLVADCEAWKKNLNAYLLAHPEYDGIITTYDYGLSNVTAPTGMTQDEAVVDGLVRAWKPFVDRGIPILAINDNPQAGPGHADCVVKNGLAAAQACAVPVAQALGAFNGLRPAAAAMKGAHLIDLTSYYCNDTNCPAVIGHVVVYRDQDHLTATYARTLAPYLGRALANELG